MKLLVVEDSSSMRSYLLTVIESGAEWADLEIVEASTGFEALKTLPHHKFDAILTDINMPDINGLELINFVKMNPHYRETPLIIVPGEARQHDRDRGIQLGASEFLIKPLEAEQILPLIRTTLARAGKCN